jgi:hypothetical protein
MEILQSMHDFTASIGREGKSRLTPMKSCSAS